MGELVDRDQEHLLLLKWGFYILAGMACVGALFSLLGVAITAFMGFGGLSGGRGVFGPPEGMLFVMTGFVCLALLFSVVARRLRIFCMVIAGAWCLQLSFGAVIGVCALMVLTRPSVSRSTRENPAICSFQEPGGFCMYSNVVTRR